VFIKITQEKLKSAVLQSTSVQGVARILLGKPVGGNQHQHLKRMINKHGINTDHFLGYRHNLGIISNKRKTPAQVFIIGQRQKSHLLRRALIESGITYKCFLCKINTWQGKKMNLEVDHIDGNNINNRLANLRFLCPNCHSQTNSFGFKGNKYKILIN